MTTNNTVQTPRQSAEKTYMTLRLLLACIALAFPIVLVGGGLLKNIPVLPQLSAYYFTSLGDLFVAMLWVIGVGLIAYKGFTDAEDLALNAGGVLICLVGIFHMRIDQVVGCFDIGQHLPSDFLLRSLDLGVPSELHFVCAVLFYLILGYVMVFCSHASLAGHSKAESLPYRRWYTGLGIAFVLSVVASFAWYKIRQEGCANRGILIAEICGLLCFSLFWIIKTVEIRRSGADRSRHTFDRKAPRPALRSLIM